MRVGLGSPLQNFVGKDQRALADAALHGAERRHASATTTSILCDVFSFAMRQPRVVSTAIARCIDSRICRVGIGDQIVAP